MIPIPSKSPFSYKDYLPAGVKVIKHRVGWWSFGNHQHPGMENYNSADPKTCDAECATMDQMGVDVVEQLDHGPNASFHRSVIEMAAATERAGKEFAINFGSGVGPDTASYVDAITYAARTYFNAPNYQMVGGRPVVSFFGPPAAIDFTAVRKTIASANPLFLFNFTGGFTHAESDGAYNWPRPQKKADGTAIPDDFGLADILAFRAAAEANPTKLAVYGVHKGFFDPNPKDPTKSVWPVNGALVPVRRMNTQRGLVMLLTLTLVPATATMVKPATWDDHEEGTATQFSQSEFV